MARQAIQTQRAPTSPNYSQAVAAGNLVFISGTVGKDMATGVWPEGVEAQVEEALKNLEGTHEHSDGNGTVAGDVARLDTKRGAGLPHHPSPRNATGSASLPVTRG